MNVGDSCTVVLAILPGRSEAWRRFAQELLGSRGVEFERSRRELGVVEERAYLLEAGPLDLVIVRLRGRHPRSMAGWSLVAQSPFDRWLRRQLLELHGLDLSAGPRSPPELIYAWRAPSRDDQHSEGEER